MLTPEGILAIVTTAASSAVSVAGLGWWLAGKFSDVKEAASENLASHEKRDQQRHEENLQRFGSINVALARLGYRNGSGHDSRIT